MRHHHTPRGRALARLPFAVLICGAIAGCGGRDGNGGDSARADTGATATTVLLEPARAFTDSLTCYAGDGSVLARAPGTVNDGPAGLRGWIRFEAPLAGDSGPARLVDSDGRSLEARFHRVRMDSVTLAAMNDFLSVQMRLFVDDDSARGTADAKSDAAQEPAPGGGTRDFAREWTIAARRAPCDSMPGFGGASRPTS